MSRRRQVTSFLLALAVALNALLANAEGITVSITLPDANSSNYQHGAPIQGEGTIQWSPSIWVEPTKVILYVRAGSNAGIITSSADGNYQSDAPPVGQPQPDPAVGHWDGEVTATPLEGGANQYRFQVVPIHNGQTYKDDNDNVIFASFPIGIS